VVTNKRHGFWRQDCRKFSPPRSKNGASPCWAGRIRRAGKLLKKGACPRWAGQVGFEEQASCRKMGHVLDGQVRSEKGSWSSMGRAGRIRRGGKLAKILAEGIEKMGRVLVGHVQKERQVKVALLRRARSAGRAASDHSPTAGARRHPHGPIPRASEEANRHRRSGSASACAAASRCAAEAPSARTERRRPRS